MGKKRNSRKRRGSGTPKISTRKRSTLQRRRGVRFDRKTLDSLLSDAHSSMGEYEKHINSVHPDVSDKFKICGINERRTLFCLLQKHSGFQNILKQIELSEEIPWGLATILNIHLFGKGKLFDIIKPLIGYLIPKAAKQSHIHVNAKHKMVAWGIQKIIKRYNINLEKEIGPLWIMLGNIEQKWNKEHDHVTYDNLLEVSSYILNLIFILKNIIEYIKKHHHWPINKLVHSLVMPIYKDIVIQIHCLLSPFGIRIKILETPDVICPSLITISLQEMIMYLNEAMKFTETEASNRERKTAVDPLYHLLKQTEEYANVALKAGEGLSGKESLAGATMAAEATKKALQLAAKHREVWKRKAAINAAEQAAWALNSAIQAAKESYNLHSLGERVERDPTTRRTLIHLQKKRKRKTRKKKWDTLIKQVKEKKEQDELSQKELEARAMGRFGSMPGMPEYREAPEMSIEGVN